MNNKPVPVQPYIVYIPLDQHTSLKVLAAQRKITLASIFRDLINQFLNDNDDRYVPTLNDTITGVKP